MAKDLIIVGASGFGREVLQWVKHCNQKQEVWNIKGFIDDNINALDGYECDYKVINTIKSYPVTDADNFVLAIAMPHVKKNIVTYLKSKNASFATIIHPDAILSSFTQLGEGVVITANAKISPNVTIGNFVTLLGSSFGHDVVIEDYVTVTGNCSINGYVLLHEGSFIGSNACIAPGKKVGAWSVVAMGAMVIRNVKESSKVMGNPAKRIDI